MPSDEHEAIVELLRAEPSLVAGLLAACEVEVGAVLDVALTDPTLRSTTLHPDLLVELRSERLGDVSVLCEVQRAPDEAKKLTWPAYETWRVRQDGGRACVVVIALDDVTAEWAREPVSYGLVNDWRPLVIGPGQLPAIVDGDEAREAPHMAILAARLHAKTELAIDAARAAFGALDNVQPSLAALSFDLIYQALEPLAKAALERDMALSNYVPTNKWYRQAIAEGRAEGEAVGRARGELRGERDALRAVLATRGLVTTAEHEARIDACEDVATIRGWIVRAVTAGAVDDVFE